VQFKTKFSGVTILGSEFPIFGRMHNIEELKQRLLHVWYGMDQSNRTNEGHRRLEARVQTKGGHAKQLF